MLIDHLDNTYIQVGNRDGTLYMTCDTIEIFLSTTSQSFRCSDAMKGSRVRLVRQKEATAHNQLSVCEVVITGYKYIRMSFIVHILRSTLC